MGSDLLVYDDSIKGRWTARHAFSSKTAIKTGLDCILNIGSYNGWLESTLLASGRENVIGLDVNSQNVKKAKLNNPKTDFLVASALNLPFKDHTFQLITLYEVIEHIPKGGEKRCLGECYRLLSDRGILLLSTPFAALRSKLLDPAWYIGHRHYSSTQLVSVGKTVGFVSQKTSICGGIFEQLTVVLLYIFKPFGFEVPFKEWFERHRLSEYQNTKGFSTIFITFVK